MRPKPECNQARKRPNPLEHGDQRPLIQSTGDPGDQKQSANMKHTRRYGEQIRSELVESKRPKNKRDIRAWRGLRDIRNHSDEVKRPHVVVLDAEPESSKRHGLAVMHVALGRVIAEDAISYDGDFAIGEPAIWPEPGLGLDDRCWHQEE